MNLEKERKVFESSEFVKTIIHKFEWSDDFNNYQIKDCVINGNVFDHIEAENDRPILNGAWFGWQAAKAQAVPEGFDFGLSHDTKINDPKELLFRCLRNMKFKKGFRANQNWVHVKHMCCLGSTTATMLCRFFGVDPDGIKFEVIEAQEQK